MAYNDLTVVYNDDVYSLCNVLLTTGVARIIIHGIIKVVNYQF